MSFTDRSLPRSLLSLLALAAILAGCASSPKQSTKNDVDNVNVVKSVRKQGATPQAGVSDTEHVTTVTATTEAQEAAQAAIKDYFAGVQLMKANKLDDAMVIFQQIAAEHPMLSGPFVNEAIIYYRQGKWPEAIDALDQAQKVNERNPFAWNLRGMVLREQGNFKDAKAAYLRSLELDPSYAKAHFNLGVLADLYMDDLRLALTNYEQYQALQRKPDTAVGNWIKDLKNRLGIVDAPMPAAPAPGADAEATAWKAAVSGTPEGAAQSAPAATTAPSPTASPAEPAPAATTGATPGK